MGAIVTLGGPLPTAINTTLQTQERETNLLDDLNLPIEPRSPALNQRDISSQTHLVDMSPRIQVIQRIEHHIEGLEPLDVEGWILDIRMMRLQLDVGVEFARCFLRNLRDSPPSAPFLPSGGGGGAPPYHGFRLLDVLHAEQELAVEIAQVDGVQVDDVDLAEAREDEVLEQFAADAASADHEDPCLSLLCQLGVGVFVWRGPGGTYLFDLGV